MTRPEPGALNLWLIRIVALLLKSLAARYSRKRAMMLIPGQRVVITKARGLDTLATVAIALAGQPAFKRSGPVGIRITHGGL